MTLQPLDPNPSSPNLVFTPERRAGRIGIGIHGKQLLATYCSFSLLHELVLAKSDPLSAGYASGEMYPNVSRVCVCRLRHEIDKLHGSGAGRQLILTGISEEYALNLPLESVALDPGIGELVPLGVLTAAQLKYLRTLVRTLPGRWEPSDDGPTMEHLQPRPDVANRRQGAIAAAS